VRERAKQFGGEDKVWIVLDPAQPRARRVRRRRMIKAAVDLRRVEIFRDQCQRVEFRTGIFRKHASTPVGIRPAGGANPNVAQSAHGSEFWTTSW
jgi:hypothetical protein